MGIASHESLMTGIRQAVCCVLTAHSVPAVDARTAADLVAARLAAAWVNCVIHIPQGIKYRTMLRNQEIFDLFSGNNHAELGRKFRVSIQQIYQIIKKSREEYIRERQQDLFLTADTVQNQQVSAFIQAKLYVLADIMDHASGVFCKALKMDKSQADSYGEQVANWMSEHWGGQSAYIKYGKQEPQTDTQRGLFE